MKRAIRMLLFLLLVSCRGSKAEYFSYNGSRWIVVEKPVKMVRLIKKGKDVVLRFPLRSYKSVLQQLADSGRKMNFSIQNRINDDLLVCSVCRRVLTPGERFEMLLSGKAGEKRCPVCLAEHFMLFSLKQGTR